MSAKGFRTGLVSQLTGLSQKQLGRYDRTDLVKPEIQGASGPGSRRLYSRTDVIELSVLKKLLDSGLSLHKIRRALGEVRHRHAEVARPLHDCSFSSDGVSLYLNYPRDGAPLDLLHPDQPVITVAVETVARRVDHAIRKFENHRIEQVRVKGRTYLLEMVNDTESHGFVARCPELLGISTKGATVEEALAKMRGRIESAIAKLGLGKAESRELNRD